MFVINIVAVDACLCFCQYSFFFRVPLNVLIRTLGGRVPQVGNHCSIRLPTHEIWNSASSLLRLGLRLHVSMSRRKREENIYIFYNSGMRDEVLAGPSEDARLLGCDTVSLVVYRRIEEM